MLVSKGGWGGGAAHTEEAQYSALHHAALPHTDNNYIQFYSPLTCLFVWLLVLWPHNSGLPLHVGCAIAVSFTVRVGPAIGETFIGALSVGPIHRACMGEVLLQLSRQQF